MLLHVFCLFALSGNLSDSKDSPHKEATKPQPGSPEAAAATSPASATFGKAVQTQQPCSVKASLSSDICSGLGPEGGDANASSGQGDFFPPGCWACLPAHAKISSLPLCLNFLGVDFPSSHIGTGTFGNPNYWLTFKKIIAVLSEEQK